MSRKSKTKIKINWSNGWNGPVKYKGRKYDNLNSYDAWGLYRGHELRVEAYIVTPDDEIVYIATHPTDEGLYKAIPQRDITIL